ncbi:hypothetical protein DRQ36_10070 [bacterium]|nr:MAG: hypothetical protein DRQ36_10070 [bacterium]
MLKPKRVIIATILGAVFGVVCWLLASSDGPLPWHLAVSIILSRTIMGFAIGISAWRINWALHAVIMGVVFSLPGAFGALMTPSDKAVFAFWGTIVMGVIYAFLIELITSKLFKMPVKQL